MTKDDFADVGKVKVGRTTRFVTYYINDDDIEEKRIQLKEATDPPLRDKGKTRHILKEYIEEKSRNPYHMPQLELAIKYAVRNKANILSPKLGSRINNLKFVSLMLEAYNKYGLKFAALDIWGIHWIPMDMMANIVAQNRKKISRNTKKAMAKLKAKGMKFGNPNIKEATKKASEDHTRRANDFAVTMRPVVKKIQKGGANTYQDIANRLNADGIKSRYGKTWHPSNVRNLLLKIKELS